MKMNTQVKLLLLIDQSEAYGRELLKGIVRYSKEHGPWIFYKMPLYYREQLGIEGILEWARKRQIDGIIAQLRKTSDLNKIKKEGIPLIVYDFEERFEGIPNITGAYYKTGQMGADYLMGKGYRNFAFYGLKDFVWSRERFKGFEETLKKANYKCHTFNIQENEITWSYKPSQFSTWLQVLPKPIGLMACDDNQANLVSEACAIANIKVPEEVAILGVDNDEIICDLTTPPLSSIALNTEHGGYETAALMHRLINRPGKWQDIIVKPSRVVERQSTDIVAVHNKVVANAIRYIRNNPAQSISVEDVAKEVAVSRRSLEKHFKNTLGKTIYSEIKKTRTEKIRQMLTETNKSIYVIATELGFPDSRNISRYFQKEMGLTPSQFRKQFKEV